MKKKLIALFALIVLLFPLHNTLAVTDFYNDSSLIGYYRAEGSSADEKNYANGTDSSVSYSTGKFGNAFSFSGNGHVSLGTANYDFTNGQARSVSFWYKSANPSLAQLFGKQGVMDHSAVGWSIFQANPGGQTSVYLQLNGGTTPGANELQVSNYTNSGSNSLTDNNWHHILITYDGSSNASGVRIYKDGNQQTLSQDFVSLSAQSTSTWDARIGSLDGGGSAFSGLIDDLAVFSRVLTSAEDTELYNGGSGLEIFSTSASSSPEATSTPTVISANYNEIVHLATETCLSFQSGVCSRWSKQSVDIINYFDLILLILIVILPFVVIHYVRKLRI